MTARDLAAIARDLLPPIGVTGVQVVAEVTAGGRLPSGDPNGVGVVTRYRAAWTVDGRRAVPAGPALDRQRDALALAALLGGRSDG